MRMWEHPMEITLASPLSCLHRRGRECGAGLSHPTILLHGHTRSPTALRRKEMECHYLLKTHQMRMTVLNKRGLLIDKNEMHLLPWKTLRDISICWEAGPLSAPGLGSRRAQFSSAHLFQLWMFQRILPKYQGQAAFYSFLRNGSKIPGSPWHFWPRR